MAEQKMTCK